MNKLYFYLLYISLGVILLLTVPPFLKYRNYLKNKDIWNRWVKQKSAEDKQLICKFCDGATIFEQTIFTLPKSIQKKLFSFSESKEYFSYKSIRCKKCQTELARLIN